VIAFVGVVEHHIEYDFDAGFMERFDHIAKFPHMVSSFRIDTIAWMWGEIAHGAIAPVIGQPLTFEIPGFGIVELENWQQLDCRNAEFLEIRYFFDDRREGTRLLDASAR